LAGLAGTARPPHQLPQEDRNGDEEDHREEEGMSDPADDLNDSDLPFFAVTCHDAYPALTEEELLALWRRLAPQARGPDGTIDWSRMSYLLRQWEREYEAEAN
jgi:hypothetical protein